MGWSLASLRSRVFYYCATTCPRSCRILALAAWGFLFLLTGCSTTIFQSSFNSNAVNAAPTTQQATGTIGIIGNPDPVVIVSAPLNTGKDNWAKIPVLSDLVCYYSQPLLQNGTYSLTALLLIPDDVAPFQIVEFDAFAPGSNVPTPILSLNFGSFSPGSFGGSGSKPVNTVLANDNFLLQNLRFPWGKAFTVSVVLSMNSPGPSSAGSSGSWSANATITLLGANGQASGTQEVKGITFVSPPNSVGKLTLGNASLGPTPPTYVTDIIVTLKSNRPIPPFQ
jgi:hypothetical protein